MHRIGLFYDVPSIYAEEIAPDSVKSASKFDLKYSCLAEGVHSYN